MKTLNKYLLKRILINWALLIFGIVFLFILADITGNVKRISNLKDKMDSTGAFFKELSNYYFLDVIPSHISTFLPIAAIASVTLLVIQLKRHHEWVAITSGTLSVGRIMALPLLVIAFLTSALHYVNQEHVMHKLTHISIKERPTDKQDTMMQLNGMGADNARLQCEWKPKDKRMVKNVLLTKPGEYIVRADHGFWTGDEWKFRNVVYHKLLKDTAGSSIKIKYDEWRWKTNLSIKNMKKIRRNRDYMSRRQLLSLAKEYPKERSLMMKAYFRFSEYFMSWVILFVGFPFVMAASNGIQSALRATYTILAVMAVYILSYNLGEDGLPLILCCALPFILSAMVGTYFWRQMPT